MDVLDMNIFNKLRALNFTEKTVESLLRAIFFQDISFSVGPS